MLAGTKLNRLLSAMVIALIAAGCGGDGDGAGDTGEAGDAAESPVDASTAGDVTGTVTFTGDAPDPQPVDMSNEPECAEKYDSPPMSQTVLLNDNGTLRNVFVYVREGLEDLNFPAPQDETLIDQDGCRYIPHVTGMQAGQTLTFRNSDGLLHNINATPSENRPFNFSQPVEMDTDRSLNTPEIMVPIRCDVHGWMSAYVGVVDHPYFAVSNEEGTVELNTLPPGDYVIEAWHERYGTATTNVTVASGETAEISFEFSEEMAGNPVPMRAPIDPHGSHAVSSADHDAHGDADVDAVRSGARASQPE